MLSQDYLGYQDTVWFTCKSPEFSSYLKSGYFQNFIDLEFHRSFFKESTVELFGKKFPTNTCFWTDAHQLFLEIKKNFALCKRVALEQMKHQTNFISVENLRKDILKVFHVLLVNLQQLYTRYHSFFGESHNSALHYSNLINKFVQLLREIKSLLLFVGQISSINGKLSTRDFDSDTSQSASNKYHYYHLCLDIWYNCLAMVYIVQYLLPTSSDGMFCDFDDQSSSFLQLSSFVVFELSYFSINQYNNVQSFNNDPFFCPCVKEFWIMLIFILDKFNSYSETLSFWSVYLQIIIKSSSVKNSNEDASIDMFRIKSITSVVSDSSELGIHEAWLWLTSHIAHLYKYNSLGYFSEYQKPKSAYAVSKLLLNNFISTSSRDGEIRLRYALSYCIELVKLWEPSGELILPLTDLFTKKIEEKFSTQSTELLYLYKDSTSWFDYIQNITNNTSCGTERSFDRFLCILSIQLNSDSDNSLWRSLKGRIYSKFIPKKIKEMSEIGLQNCFSLFLIIAASGQFDVITKICEVASVIETVANPSKQIISWKAIFVLMYICQEKKYDVKEITKEITTVISKFFDRVSKDYSKFSKDSLHKTNLMELLSVYLTNMNILFSRNSSLNLSEYQLISSGFSSLLSIKRMSEANYILGIILSILQRIQKEVSKSKGIDTVTSETEYIKTLELIFDNIYPFIKDIALEDDAPLVVSDIAATLTKLTYDFSSSINCMAHDYHNIFIYFACKESVSSIISCQYLCLIFNFPDLVTGLNLKVKNLDVLITQAWLKSIICVQTKNNWMQDLSKKVIQQTTIIEILPNVKNLNFQADDHVDVAIEFFCHLGDAFNSSSSEQKCKIAQKVQSYFKIYPSFVPSKIKKDKDKPALSHVYKLMSHLVKNCSSVLHFHVTSDRILLQILDQTVYPHILFPTDKSLQSLVSCSIKEYLPNFIRGLIKLNYKTDKAIEREIKDIFIYYLGMFPASKNPLTKLMISFLQEKGELKLDACNFILGVLKSSLLAGNIEKPISIFEFYFEVFQLSPTNEITNIILTSALEICMKQNNSFVDSLKVILKKTLRYFKEKIPLNNMSEKAEIILVPVLKWFICEKLQWSVKQGFSILDIFVEYLPQIMSNMVPCLTETIETIENKRGYGEDIELRNGLRYFINKLQKKLAQL